MVMLQCHIDSKGSEHFPLQLGALEPAEKEWLELGPELRSLDS